MEYVEMAGASTGMLDKFLTSDTLARVTGGSYPPAGPSGPAFRAVPLPVFPHVKQSTSPTMSFISQTATANLGLEFSRRAAMPAAFATTSTGPMNGVSAGMVDIIQVQEPVVEATLQNDGVGEQKGKKTQEGGGRGSRVGGSRKRTRVGQPVDLLSARGELVDGVASRAIGLGRGASGVRQRAANGEKEKTATRWQTGQGVKRGDKKASQSSATPKDAPHHKNWTGNRIPSGSNGILGMWLAADSEVADIYGLKTKPIDLSQYMLDISLNDLLSANYNVSPVFSKEPVPTGNVTEPSFEQQVSDSFQHMPKKSANVEIFNAGNLVNKEVSQKSRMVLDLECPLHPEEEEAPGLANVGWYHAKDERVGAEKETSGSAFATPPDKASGSSSSRLVSSFDVDNLPLYSLEEFLSRLKLPSSDPLELLIAKAGVANNCTMGMGGELGTSSNDHCRNGIILPLPFSLPPVGPVKSELDHEKGSKLGRASQRRWVTGGTSTPSRSSRGLAGSSGLSHKEEPEVTGGESVSTGERKSSSGRRTRKYEKTEHLSRKQDCMQFCSPDGPQTPSPPQETGSAVASKGSLASDEAREVENAVRLSSNWQAQDLMEIDLRKPLTGAVTPLVDNTIETEDVTLSVPTTQTQQAVSADVVRWLDVQMPAAFGEPSLKMLTGKEEENTTKEARKELGEGPSSLTGKERVPPVLEVKVQEINQSIIPTDPSTSYIVMPGSPNAQAAAHILCYMANSIPVEQVNPEVEKQKRARVFSPYGGAPTQRATKASKNGASGSVTVDSAGEAEPKGGTGKETVSMTPVNGNGCERRKSLSQFNDASPAKPHPTTGARGGLFRAAVGPRSSHNSHRGDKGSKEGNARDGSGNRTGVSSSPGGGTKSTTVFGMSRGLGGARNTLASSLLKEAATVSTKLGAGSKERVDVKGLRPHSNGVSHPLSPAPTVAVKSSKQIVVANGVGRHRGGKSSRDW